MNGSHGDDGIKVVLDITLVCINIAKIDLVNWIIFKKIINKCDFKSASIVLVSYMVREGVPC